MKMGSSWMTLLKVLEGADLLKEIFPYLVGLIIMRFLQIERSPRLRR